MNKEITIKILNEGNTSTEKIAMALKTESKFFRINIESKDNVDIILKEDNLESIIILFLNKKLNKYNFEKLIELSKDTRKINIIDREKFISKTKKEILLQNKSVRIIEECEDIHLLAFSVLYNYYEENIDLFNKENKGNKGKKIFDKDKYNFVMKKYEECVNKDNILNLIDDFLLEGKKYNFKGYEELKMLILICIICDVKEDDDEQFLYIYKVISEIYKKNIKEIRTSLTNAINLIRCKKVLKASKTLLEQKGKPLIIQTLKVSNLIKDIKMDM